MVAINTVTLVLSVKFTYFGEDCAVIMGFSGFIQFAKVQLMQFRFYFCLCFIAVLLLFRVQLKVRIVDY